MAPRVFPCSSDAVDLPCCLSTVPNSLFAQLLQLLNLVNVVFSVGVPVKLLHEAAGHIVTLELKTGLVYRGKLLEVEDNMNLQLKDVTATHRDGHVTQLDQVFIRGSHLRFVIVPDMLKNAPLFKRMDPRKSTGKGIGMGRGRATVARAQRGRGGRGGGGGPRGGGGGFGGPRGGGPPRY